MPSNSSFQSGFSKDNSWNEWTSPPELSRILPTLFRWLLKTKRNPAELLWFPIIQGLDATHDPCPAFSCQVYWLDCLYEDLEAERTGGMVLRSGTSQLSPVSNCDDAWNVDIREFAPRAFVWGCSCRIPLYSTYQNSRLPEEKQVCSINHIICTNSLCTMRESENYENLPKSKFPDTSQGFILQADLSKDSFLKDALLTCFCTYQPGPWWELAKRIDFHFRKGCRKNKTQSQKVGPRSGFLSITI